MPQNKQKNQNNIQFELLQMSPRFTNSVLVHDGDDCVIFDAWGRADDWLKLLGTRNLKLTAIYSTHGHPDHISAAPDLVDDTGCKWFLNGLDFDLYAWGDDLLIQFGLPPMTRGIMPISLPENPIQIFPNVNMQIIQMPGHTPGGVAFYFPDNKICLTGDSIFADGIGRTDLPGGDFTQLMQSISNFYNLNLPNDTVVVPGHGNITTVSELKTINPWFKPNK